MTLVPTIEHRHPKRHQPTATAAPRPAVSPPQGGSARWAGHGPAPGQRSRPRGGEVVGVDESVGPMRLTTPSLLLVPSSRPLESRSPAVTWATSWRRAMGGETPYHPRWSSGSADEDRRQDRRGRLVGRGAGRRLGRFRLDGFRPKRQPWRRTSPTGRTSRRRLRRRLRAGRRPGWHLRHRQHRSRRRGAGAHDRAIRPAVIHGVGTFEVFPMPAAVVRS